MAWPEVSIEDLPPERDDEPASLRQDIFDELADHFVCALNRELLKNPNEQIAKQLVIKLFGDPVKIARQLWLDAMKEKIMSQRIMTGLSVVMAVCGFIVVGFVWSMMEQSERVNLKMLEQLASIADRPQSVTTTKMDAQILMQLEQLNQKQTTQGGSASEEMNQITIQLVQQREVGKPMVGISGELVKTGGKTDSFRLSAVTDQSGKLDFGKLPWGNYSLKLHTPWNEKSSSWNFATIPGRNYSQTIICPANAPQNVPVRFHVNWPDTFKSEDWVLLCDFRTPLQGKELVPYTLKSKRRIQNHIWYSEQSLQHTPKGV